MCGYQCLSDAADLCHSICILVSLSATISLSGLWQVYNALSSIGKILSSSSLAILGSRIYILEMACQIWQNIPLEFLKLNWNFKLNIESFKPQSKTLYFFTKMVFILSINIFYFFLVKKVPWVNFYDCELFPFFVLFN